MGGAAFRTGKFPRLPLAQYRAALERQTHVLKTLYSLVTTPVEALEKVDYGDVDFVVWKEENLPTHDEVKGALGATMVIPMDGPRTSHYAVPLAEQVDTFYQVDVHVCESKEAHERTVFFHSYGDMGMIMGLIVRGMGLHIGVHGLRVRRSVAGV